MKLLLVLLSVIALGALVGCTQQYVADIKTEDMIGERVAVAGTVESSWKLGDFSGYIIKDSRGDTIGVSSDALPADGSSVTARGTVMRDTLFGYYIKANE
jgi:hypothetical protein